MYIAPYSDWLQSAQTYAKAMLERMECPEYAAHYAKLAAHYALLLINNTNRG